MDVTEVRYFARGAWGPWKNGGGAFLSATLWKKDGDWHLTPFDPATVAMPVDCKTVPR
ncbi:MAG TPA: hypothetical protein VEU08_00115 [Vicinamibacterales bacterium]|nr:hypothetical protein [Vicinamibacterales bacterium]